VFVLLTLYRLLILIFQIQTITSEGMSWLWGSSGDAASSKASKDEAYVAPDRTKRVMCWDSRDEYFQCLNRNSILDALKDQETAAKECGKETQAFEQNCAASWVSLDTSFFSHAFPLSVGPHSECRFGRSLRFKPIKQVIVLRRSLRSAAS